MSMVQVNTDGWDSESEADWPMATDAIRRGSLAGLKVFMEGPDAPSVNNPKRRQCLNFLLHMAATADSVDCVAYLAGEFDCNIHASAIKQMPTTLIQAIHCHEDKPRALMFRALMNIARAERVHEEEGPWTRALRAAALAGDAVIFKDLCLFIGPKLSGKWVANILDSDGEDVWMLAARGRDPKMVAALLDMPEMMGLLAPENASRVADISAFAMTHHSEEFAKELKAVVAAWQERESIAQSMRPSKLPIDGRASSLRI